MGRIQADYQHIRSALDDVRTKGYGVVAPAPGDLQLAEPEIVRKGGRYGVRLKASAKAIHMFQTNIETEISPEIGGENASSEILGFLLQGFDGDVEQLWQSNIFGKPIYTIAQEGVVEHPKPAPDTFLVTAEKLGMEPEDCLVVEDSTNGGGAARAAGMKCIWFHNPDSGRQDIPDAVLEFPAWTSENVEKMLKILGKEGE